MYEGFLSQDSSYVFHVSRPTRAELHAIRNKYVHGLLGQISNNSTISGRQKFKQCFCIRPRKASGITIQSDARPTSDIYHLESKCSTIRPK